MVLPRELRNDACGRIEHIEEGFVDDQQAIAVRDFACEPNKVARRNQAAGRIVRIDDDGRARLRQLGEGGRLDHDMAGPCPGVQVLFVGGRKDRDVRRSQQARDDLDEALRARCGDDVLGTGGAIARGGRTQQGLLVARQRKPRPGLRRDVRDRIGNRIDAGRKVDPRFGCGRKTSPSRRRDRRRGSDSRHHGRRARHVPLRLPPW